MADRGGYGAEPEGKKFVETEAARAKKPRWTVGAQYKGELPKSLAPSHELRVSPYPSPSFPIPATPRCERCDGFTQGWLRTSVVLPSSRAACELGGSDYRGRRGAISSPARQRRVRRPKLDHDARCHWRTALPQLQAAAGGDREQNWPGCQDTGQRWTTLHKTAQHCTLSPAPPAE